MSFIFNLMLFFELLAGTAIICEEAPSGASNEPSTVLNERGEIPSVLLSIIARNEEKTLPTYLGYIERLNYPKSHISVL